MSEKLVIRTTKKLPKLGVMLVGWGGNNGSTFTAAILANKLHLSWPTKKGTQKANWYGKYLKMHLENKIENNFRLLGGKRRWRKMLL